MSPLLLFIIILAYFSLLMLISHFASRKIKDTILNTIMHKQVLFLFMLVVFSSVNLISNSQSIKSKNTRAELVAEIDSILQSQVDQDKIPGAVIEIKKGSQIIYRHAYGYAQKYNYNHLLLSHPEKMTTRHLLTHTSGLFEWYPLYYRSENKKETYMVIGDLPLMFPVGEQRRYSDLGFMLLGEIVEIVSGLSLEQFVQQNVFTPLGMKNTTFNPLNSGRFKKIAATSHGNPYEKRMVYDSTLGFKIREIDPTEWNGWRTYTLRGEVNDGNTWYANGGISGAAGLFSTVDDLQKFVDMIMNNGEIRKGQFISAKTIEFFLTKDKFNNGLGWMMDPVNSFMKNGPEGTFGHTGFTGTSITVIPKSETSIVLLINRQNRGLLNTGEYYNINPVRLQVFNAVLKYTGN